MIPDGGSAQPAPVTRGDPSPADNPEGKAPPTHITRGFLFADLRGYTAFTEAHGDAAAGRLLETYRLIVRGVVSRYGGAEIKTEGDSFYVVFPSASAAVSCGVAIVMTAAEETIEHPDLPLAVGVGVHAGETADSEQGYVGSAVNVAARLCSAASAGEVLVSDTVRGLTRTGGEVRYVPRGHRRFKGISEPIPVFAATLAGSAAAHSGQRTRLVTSSTRLALAVAAVVVVLLLAVSLVPRAQPTSSPSPTATLAAVGTSPSLARTATAQPTPSATSAFAEMPFGEPVPPSGRYSLRKFYLSPDLETDGRWRLGDCRGPVRPCVYDINGGYDGGLVQLHRSDRPQSMLTLFHPTQLLTDPCGNDPVRQMGPGDSFLKWLHTQTALTTTGDVQRAFEYVKATQFYVTVVPANATSSPVQSQTPCPYTDPDSVALRTFGDWSGFTLDVGKTNRVYAITVPAGVYAFLIAPSQEEFDLVIPVAEELLNTLRFP